MPPVSETYPTSPMQAGMVVQALLHDASGRASGFDIEQIHLLFDEPLDGAALADAWTMIARRHPVLTSCADWADPAAPRQSLHPEVEVPVDLRPWRALGPEERAHHVTSFLTEDRARGFDLRQPPLQRVTILERDDDRTEIVWTFHHFLLDGRSFAPVLSEVLRTYVLLRAGASLELPPSPPPFRDHVTWLHGRDRAADQTFFRALLHGKAAPTPLPVGGRSVPESAVRGRHGVARRPIEPALIERLRARARASDITVATMAQAAWAIVLARFTGDNDVVFGLVRSARTSATNDGRAQNTIGFLTNTIPARVAIADELTVGELLAAVRRQSVAMRAFQHASLLEIQRVSELPPGTPLFQTLLLFEDEGFASALRADPVIGDRVRQVALHEQPPYPLTLKIDHGVATEASLTFEPRRVAVGEASRLLDAFVYTLGQLAENPDRPLRELTALPPDERRKILFDWNDTAAPAPDGFIHDAFEAQVRAQPDAVALEADGTTLTFRELDRRATALAHQLRARGAGPGAMVGVYLQRTPALITALLAIAKTGAAYLPLDHRHPPARVRWMAEDAQVALIVSEAGLATTFAGTVPLLDVTVSSAAPAPAIVPAGTTDDPCYVIYTSGSTGTPKGVMLSHRAVVNTCAWVNRTFAVGPGDRALFVTSPSFDLSVYDLFGVLGAGATVVLASASLLADPPAIARALADRGITLWNSAPATLQLVVPFLTGHSTGIRLRLILLSGDWIALGLVRALFTLLPNARVVSLGGATEAAIWSNWFPIEGIDPTWPSVPYGRPIQNCRYHVLDGGRRPVPVGLAGELYIGGACLAKGYLNRPELTAERFVPDPFSTEPGARLFRTGDRARYFEDGTLELLGRLDRQVKVRGFRVELAELDAALAAIAGVRAATSVAGMDRAGQRSLIAYVVPERDDALTEAAVTEATIKAALSQVLPDFMLPARVVFLAALPLSANGKVDVAALPSPAPSGAAPIFETTATTTERRLTVLWERVLQRAPVRRDDNFFALGGHSLLAVQLFDQVNRTFDLKLPLSALFDHPTVATLAAHLDALAPAATAPAHAAPPWSTLVPLRPAGALPPFFCVAGVGGNPIGERRLATALGREQTMFALQHRGVDGAHAPHRSLEGMAREFLADIRRVQPGGPYYVGGFSAGGVAAFELARLLKQEGESVALLVLLDTFNPRLAQWSPLEQAWNLVRLARHYGPGYVGRRLATRYQRQAHRLKALLAPASGAFERRHAELHAAFMAALDAYEVRPYRHPTLLIRSSQSRCPDVNYRPHLSNGWSALIGPALQVTSLDCRHDELLDDQVEAVAQRVRAALAMARRIWATDGPSNRTVNMTG